MKANIFLKAGLTATAVAVAALLSCGDDDERSEQPTHYTVIEKSRVGLIENDCSEETAKSNSDALQHAIDSLAGAGEYRLRLERGDYCIWGVDGNHTRKIIKIPSNVALDLNGSTVRLSPTDEQWTSVFEITQAENVKLFNGTVIGDRETHIYGRLTGSRSDFNKSNDWASHEYGNGIRIYNGKNVELYDLTVREVTGDGIGVSYESSNITIRNCIISRARRGGIVSDGGEGLIIRDNYIFDIYNDVVHRDESGLIITIGAEACIAFEATGNRKVSNVQVYNNILNGISGENTLKRLFFSIHSGAQNIVIRDNVLIGSCEFRYGRNILFKNNKMSDGDFMPGGTVNSASNTGFGENVIFEGNELDNVEIGNTHGTISESHPHYKQNFAYIGNKFYNSSRINAQSYTNIAIIDNEFITGNPEYAGIIAIISAPPNSGIEHKYFCAGNKIPRRTLGAEEPGFNFPRMYRFPDLDNKFFTLSDAEPMDKTQHPDIPEWYSESNNRAEAVAWVDSWKWF